FAPGGAGGGERGGERGAGKRQQRTQAEAFAGNRLHGTRRGQTGGAAAAGESHEHGLGDVVLVMTEAEQVDAAAAKFAVEKRVAGDAGGGFGDGGFLGGPVRPSPGGKRNAERVADALTETGVGGGGGSAQAMIKVKREQTATGGGGGRVGVQEEQQRERIGPAGKRDGDTIAGGPGGAQAVERGRMQTFRGESRGERGGDDRPVHFLTANYADERGFERATRFHVSRMCLKFKSKARSKPVIVRYPII